VTQRSARYAGLVTRLAALLLDGLLLAIAVPALALGPPQIWSAVLGSAPGWLKAGAQVCGALLPLVYFTAAWWSTGQTLGDVVFGIVVRRNRAGHVGVTRAFLRALVGLLLPAIWLLGMVLILTDRKRRALHDRLFGTVVLRKAVELPAPAESGRPAAQITAADVTAGVTSPR